MTAAGHVQKGRFVVVVTGLSVFLLLGPSTGVLGAAGVELVGPSPSSMVPYRDCDPHPPIVVNGDIGFTNPLSGVRSGSGTAEDPYLIEGWCISTVPALYNGVDGINLENTRSHVVIRGNFIEGPVDLDGLPIHFALGDGIVLMGTDNVTIEDNHLVNTSQGVWLYRGGSNNVIRNNTIEGQIRGIYLVQAFGTLVERNELTLNGRGIDVSGGTLRTAENITIRDNRIKENTDHGIMISGGARNILVEANDLRMSRWGVVVSESYGVLLSDNDIRANRIGVILEGVNDTAVHENRIQGNRVGLNASGVQNVNATFNWWGCPEGPGHQGCDAVEGDVVYEPWLSSPYQSMGDVEEAPVVEAGSLSVLVFASTVALSVLLLARSNGSAGAGPRLG